VSRPRASVLIPTRRPGAAIGGVLRSVFEQRVEWDFEVVVVDSGSPPEDLRVVAALPVRLFRIHPKEFGHGRTRNLLGTQALGEVLVYLSQDAQPVGPDWLRLLVEALDEDRVAGSYARQIPWPSADPLTRFFLTEVYPATPQRRRNRPDSRLRLADIFFSNVSSAIRRDVWQRIPFRPDLVMSEDQYWAWDALHNGYELRYVPDAQVYHSHSYTLSTLFARNRLSAYSLYGLVGDSAPYAIPIALRYFAREVAYLLRQREVAWLPYMLLAELTRAVACTTGCLEARVGRFRCLPP
jgi:rhamnosyltransferase